VTRDAAVAAAARGFAVFPLKVGEKTPAVPGHKAQQCTGRDPWCRDGHQGWEPRATTALGRIRRGWASAPYNVGAACGPSRLVVVDLDLPKPDEGKELPEDWHLPGISDGKDVFAQVCEWAGMDWPQTYTVAMPSGGWHLYFTAPEGSDFRNTADAIGPMIDTRANGGYVVAAGSVTAAGAYGVLHDEPVQPLPRWIARLLTPSEPERSPRPDGLNASPDKRIAGLVRTVEASQPRKRTGVLVWAAYRLGEMIGAGEAAGSDGELLVQGAVKAGIVGGESYARQQVESVLRKGTR
jgi:hypothetical protein